MSEQSGTTLYRFFDAEGRLLYVGITSRGPQRWSEHEANREWWAKVVRSTTEHFDGRELALAAERVAIKSELPLHNVRHTVERTPVARIRERRRGDGSILFDRQKGLWAAVTPPPERRWFRFPTKDQAEAFLAAYLAARDPDVRRALIRALDV